jgi:NAD(P)-dependent dehydrogenase (short-subunit alcohol dehydrogenase family)
MNNRKYYSEKIAIVTGGGSGIGKAICEYLGKNGSEVVVADINLASARETANIITTKGGKAKAMKVDVTIYQEVKQLIDETVNNYGRIDLLFNNAGVAINGEFQYYTLEHLQKMFNVNFWGVVHGCQIAYPIMINQGNGQIVNSASMNALIPMGLNSGYAASKSAVAGLSLSLRTEAEFFGIKVNTLCLGLLNTALQRDMETVSDILTVDEEERIKAYSKLPSPEDVIHKVMKDIQRNKRIIIDSRLFKTILLIYKLSPRIVDMYVKKLLKKYKRTRMFHTII